MKKKISYMMILLCLLLIIGCGKDVSDINSNKIVKDSSANEIKNYFDGVKSDKWLISTLNYYRKLGFFASDKKKSNESLAKKIKSTYIKEVGDNWNQEVVNKYADMDLLIWDKESVWYEDIEADVGAGNKIYVDVLNSWSKISKDRFNPKNIKEVWEGETGPVTVSYLLDGKKYVLKPNYIDDFIDIGILKEINKSINSDGYQFEVIQNDEQTFFVLMLNEEEKVKLETERGLKFDTFE